MKTTHVVRNGRRFLLILCIFYIDSLRHLWVADLLPESKLKYFNEVSYILN